jgi:putative transposase
VVTELCRQHGFSDATFYKWRAKYGGMEAADAQRLKALEAENGRLKRLLTEAHLDIEALKIGFGVKHSPINCDHSSAPRGNSSFIDELLEPAHSSHSENRLGYA